MTIITPETSIAESVEIESDQVLNPDLAKMAEGVQKHGDVLDRMPWLRRNATVGIVAMVGTGITAAYDVLAAETTSSLLQPGIAPVIDVINGVALLSATGVAAGVTKPLSRMYHRHKPKQQIAVQETLSDTVFDSEPVELYRSRVGHRKNRELQLFWHGPEVTSKQYSSRQLHSRLVALEATMQTTQAKRVILPTELIREYMPEISEDTEEDSPHLYTVHMTTNEWLHRFKKTNLVDKQTGNREVSLLNAQALSAIIEKTKHAESEEPLHTIMQLLRHVYPNHPSLAKYQIGIKADVHKRPIFERSITMSLNSKLYETMTELLSIDDDNPTLREKKKVNFVGNAIMSPTQSPLIRWQRQGDFSQNEIGDLLSYFRTSEGELSWLPENYKDLPDHKVIALCEVAAWLCLHDQIAPPSRFEEGGSAHSSDIGLFSETTDPERGLQARIADRVIKPARKRPSDAHKKTGIGLGPNRLRRVTRSFVLLGAAAVIGGGLGHVTEQYSASTSAQSLVDAAQMLNLNVNLNKIPYDEQQKVFDISNRLLDTPLQRALNFVENTSDNYSGWTEEKLSHLKSVMAGQFTEGEFAALSQAGEQIDQSSQIGNVANSPNVPIWLLSSHGMSSTGYWPESTYRNFDTGSFKWLPETNDIASEYGVDPNLTQADYYKKAMEVYAAMPSAAAPNSVDATSPHISVQRSISLPAKGVAVSTAADAAAHSHEYATFGMDYSIPIFVIPIPVMEGSKVIAASYNDSATVKILVQKDGTSVALVRGADNPTLGELRYVVAPDATAGIKAVGATLLEGVPIPQDQLDATWKDASKLVASHDPEQRLTQEVDLLQKFSYKLAPLPDGYPKADGNTSARDYMEQILRSKAGNCNTANTALVLSNPDTLNYATGFHNTNTALQEQQGIEVLSTGEEHAFAITKDKRIIDATPGENISASDAKHFVENFSSTAPDPRVERESSLEDNALAVAGLIALGIAGWQRRRLRKISRAGLQKVATLGANSISPETLAIAYETVNHVVYSNSTDKAPLLDKATFSKLRERVSTKDAAPYTAAWATQLKIDPESIKAAAAQKSHLSRPARQAVRRAQLYASLLRISGKA